MIASGVRTHPSAQQPASVTSALYFLFEEKVLGVFDLNSLAPRDNGDVANVEKRAVSCSSVTSTKATVVYLTGHVKTTLSTEKVD